MILNGEPELRKILILEELKEHTVDCDWARSQHFNEADYYRGCAKLLRTVQAFCFIGTIIFYVVLLYLHDGGYSSGDQEILKHIGLILSCVAIAAEVYSYISDYSGLVERHERSGHMYTQLYRKCQFFCTDNQDHMMSIWVEKLNGISEELSRLAVLSPDLSERSYEKVRGQMNGKEYPVDKLLQFNGEWEGDLNDIVDDIVNVCGKKGYELEIYWCGTSMVSYDKSDIDMVICLYGNLDQKEHQIIEGDLILIEQNYLNQGLSLDLTLLLKEDILSNRFFSFLNNVKKGKLLYGDVCIQPLHSRGEYSFENADGLVEFYKNEVEFAHSQKREKYFILSLFYMYYHALCRELNSHKISWKSEKDVIDQSYILAKKNNDNELISVVQHARYIQKVKDYTFLENSIVADAKMEYLKNLFDIDKNKLSK